MMPLGAPSISKYGSLVRPDAQIVALRAHCTRTALKAPPMTMYVCMYIRMYAHMYGRHLLRVGHARGAIKEWDMRVNHGLDAHRHTKNHGAPRCS